jgi:hypothetical protein
VSLVTEILRKYKCLIDAIDSLLSQDYTSLGDPLEISGQLYALPVDPNEL